MKLTTVAKKRFHFDTSRCATFGKAILLAWMLIFSKTALCFDLKLKQLKPTDEKRIAELKWSPTPPSATFGTPEIDGEVNSVTEILEKIKLVVKVEGLYSRTSSGWTMLLKDRPLDMKPDGSFSLNFLIIEKTQWVDLTAVSEDGTIETEKVGIEIENFDEFIAHLKEKKVPTFYRVALGYRVLSYSQKNVPTISQNLYELLGDYRRSLTPDQWSAWLGGSFQVPASQPEPNISKLSYVFSSLGLMYRLPYTPPDPLEWQARVGGALFTKMMLASPKLFGYSMAGGIMAVPEFQYPITKEHSVSARLTLGFAASSFSPAQFFQQQLRKFAIKWESKLLEDYIVFLEAETSQFLLQPGDLNELTSGIALGAQF